MGVFRQPPNIRPRLPFAAALFDVPPTVDDPPLRLPLAMAAAQAAYRPATVFHRQRPVDVSVLFPVVTADDPPISAPAPRGAWRPNPIYPQHLPALDFTQLGDPLPPPRPLSETMMVRTVRRPYPPASQGAENPMALLDLEMVDAPCGLDTQTPTLLAYRTPYIMPQRLRQPPDLFGVVVVDDPPPPKAISETAMARTAWRGPWSQPAQRVPPPPLNDLGDDVPLAGSAQRAAQAAYRALWSVPPQRLLPPDLSQLGDDVPLLQPASNLMARTAWRPPWSPAGSRPFPQAIFAPATVPDDPPLTTPAALFARLGWRPPWSPVGFIPPASLLFQVSLPDDPPLRTQAQAFAQAAWRPYYPPGQRARLAISIFDPVVVDDPPFGQTIQRIAQAAYRGNLFPLVAAIQYNMRMDAALALLFPAAPAATPSPITAVANSSALTAAQVTAMRADITKMNRRLEYLISVLEKRGLKI